MKNNYPKKERLCSKTIIEAIFVDRNVVSFFPLKAFWILHDLPENVPVQSGISVSKKLFKRANKRNLIKRRMREAFRLNKWIIYPTLLATKKQLAVFIVYNHNRPISFDQINVSMAALLEKLKKKLEETSKEIA